MSDKRYYNHTKDASSPTVTCKRCSFLVLPAKCQEKKVTSNGFTLLEVIIALVILFVTMLPLINSIYRNNSLVRAEQLFTGMCILEQERFRFHCIPGQRFPSQRRIINNDEWVTTTNITGTGIRTISMMVKKNRIECGNVVFLDYDEK
jgi:Tfp pilus assembly major pilin PilA